MTKRDLVKEMARQAGVSQAKARLCLVAFMEAIKTEIKNEKEVELVGFGCFRPWHQSGRPGWNITTMERCQIPSRLSVKFKPSRMLLDEVNS